MNDVVQDWINGLAGRVHVLDMAMRFSANDIVFLIPAFLLALWFWPDADRALRQRVAVATCIAVAGGLLASTLIGQIWHEARPFVADHDTRQLISHSADNSFPSEHAAVAFAVAGVAVWTLRGIGIGCLVAAALVGFSRIYVGVHWPLDIMTSAIVSMLIGTALAAA